MKWFIVMMMLCGSAFGAEQITSYNKESLPVLNEELRKTLDGIRSARSGDLSVQERTAKIEERLAKIEVAMQTPMTEVVNLCQRDGTTFTRSLTYDGTTWTPYGSAGDEVDENASTAYGGTASAVGTASVTLTETITFTQSYHVSSVYFKAGCGGGGSSSGSGSMYLKLKNSSGSVIATLFNNTAVGSVFDNTTYDTGWDDVKSIEYYGFGSGGGQYAGTGGVSFFEIQAYATVRI